MSIQQQVATNRIQFEENSQGLLQNAKSNENTLKQNDLFIRLANFSPQQKLNAFQVLSQSKQSPRKNSGYSTYEDEYSFEEDCTDVCEEFYNNGACMKGVNCDLLPDVKCTHLKKIQIKETIMQNFPQLLVIKMNLRIKSFLA